MIQAFRGLSWAKRVVVDLARPASTEARTEAAKLMFEIHELIDAGPSDQVIAADLAEKALQWEKIGATSPWTEQQLRRYQQQFQNGLTTTASNAARAKLTQLVDHEWDRLLEPDAVSRQVSDLWWRMTTYRRSS